MWWVVPSSGAAATSTQFGERTDVPVPGDYDGDGKFNLAIFRPSEGTWNVRLSSGGPTRIDQWGVATDVLLPADYDRDRKTDLAYYRPSDGKWHIRPSKGGADVEVSWGDPSDMMVPADYDGDGKTDIAFFRPWEGTWNVVLSSTGATRAFSFGTATDRVVPADYDGDGKADFAYYHPSDRTWHVSPSRGTQSRGGSTVSQFGAPSDLIPYHLSSASCGGFNPKDRLTPPYDCSAADLGLMVMTGWPSDQRRRNIVAQSLSGEEFGHSQIVIAVSDNNEVMISIGGNQGFPIDGVLHHCVSMTRGAFYVDNVLIKKVDAYGDVTKFF